MSVRTQYGICFASRFQSQEIFVPPRFLEIFVYSCFEITMNYEISGSPSYVAEGLSLQIGLKNTYIQSRTTKAPILSTLK
jgi:hypothetical protein